MDKPIIVSKTYEAEEQVDILKVLKDEIDSSELGILTYKTSHKTKKDETGELIDIYKLTITRDYTK